MIFYRLFLNQVTDLPFLPVYGVNFTPSVNFSDQNFIGTDKIATSARPEEQSVAVDEDIVVGMLSRTEVRLVSHLLFIPTC